jgi:hypothetical protein
MISFFPPFFSLKKLGLGLSGLLDRQLAVVAVAAVVCIFSFSLRKVGYPEAPANLSLVQPKL